MPECEVRFRLLGPVELVVRGRPVGLTGKQRTLLSLLLVQADRPVSVERLKDGIWGEEPPASADARVRALVAELRRACGPAGAEVVVTRSPGYLVRVEPGALDTQEFTESVDRAKRAAGRGDLAEAVASYRDGLALWRGGPLADVRGGPLVSAEARRLAGQRLDALEGQAEAKLALGRYQEVIADLNGLVAEEPQREHPRAQLMRALHHSGRRAEALEAYRSFRGQLVDELGVEPGEALREVHQRILRGEVAAGAAPVERRSEVGAPAENGVSAEGTVRAEGAVRDAGARRAEGAVRDIASAVSATPPPEVPLPVPRQLPPSTGRFIGRTRELDALDRLSAEPSRVVLVVGPAGTGKSSLAVHWARQAADRFPGGQLHLDLRGFDRSEPMSPGEALPLLLGALGRAPEHIPHQLDAQIQLYRSLLVGRRALVVLDDVACPDQVRPLLPGDPGCLVVMTSRDRLPGLVAVNGASRLSLDSLGNQEALELLAQRVGEARLRAEPEAAAGLVELCGRLPLALTVAGAQLADQSHHTVGDYVRELTERGRLDRLSIPGDEHAAVRAAFALTYRALAPAARRMFRLLGLAPSGGLTTAVAATLADVPRRAARDLLDAIARVHLVHETAAHRFVCHDLLTEFAVERSAEEDGAEDRHAAVMRLFEYYLRSVGNAARANGLHELSLPYEQVSTGVVAETFDSPSEALTWVDTVWDDITAAVAHAAENGPPCMAWLLMDALTDLLHHGRPLTEWVRLAELALGAARAHHNAPGQAAMELSLGHARWRMGRLEEARHHYEQAEALARSADWRTGEAHALRGVGVTLRQLGEPATALLRHRASLAIDRERDDRRGESVGLVDEASALLALGEPDAAEECLTRALPLTAATGNVNLESIALVALARVQLKRARFDTAAALLERARIGAMKGGFRCAEAMAHEALGRLHSDRGAYEGAIGAHIEALLMTRAAENTSGQVDALSGLAYAEACLGRTEEAVRHAELALYLVGRTGHRTGLVDVHIAAAEAHRRAERPEAATHHARTAVALGDEGHRASLGQARVVLARVLLGLGDAAGALAEARRALLLAEESGQRLIRARALLALGDAYDRADAAGDETGAAAAARRSARELFEAIGLPCPRAARAVEDAPR
ncbi:AfsR/SARP family transcriptional regulator [Streptomyces cucumeris]|uniref:AfsR/SARP family transcriptional regulator n=1 Tax=Streptomyces cucumeris TaxID=2962890 RepID=UPI003D744B87